jgi:hypothetical protein
MLHVRYLMKMCMPNHYRTLAWYVTETVITYVTKCGVQSDERGTETSCPRSSRCFLAILDANIKQILTHGYLIRLTLTFRGPCIVIYSCIKTTRCTNFSNLFFGIEHYMFRRVPLSIIRSLVLYTQQQVMSYKLCWLLASKLSA